MGRAVEPLDGGIAVTLGAAGGSCVGPEGDLSSQALNPIANTNSNTLRWVLFVMAFSLNRKRENAART